VKTLLAWLLAVAACGDDGGTTFEDAALADPCAPEMTFTGELLDWDSNDTTFVGVPGVTFSVGAASAKTAPNGRFMLCIPAMNGVVDVAPAAAQDRLEGTVVVERLVLGLQPIQSYRSLSQTRALDLGVALDKAHVFVHVDGAPRTVTTSTTAGIQQVFGGAAWSDGNTGQDIFLGNIEPAATTTLTVGGGESLGGGDVPLTAGELTYITVIAR
jgi:hypothetical protein